MAELPRRTFSRRHDAQQRKLAPPPPVSAVEATFTTQALRAQQLRIWRAGEQQLRARQASLDRASERSAKLHDAALGVLQRQYEQEASLVWALLRQAHQKRTAAARGIDALRAKRSKLEQDLRTYEPRAQARVAELTREIARVQQRVHDAQRQLYELTAAGKGDWADAELMARLLEMEGRRGALKVAVDTGQEYAGWLQEQLDACATGEAPARLNAGKSSRRRRTSVAAATAATPPANAPAAAAAAAAASDADDGPTAVEASAITFGRFGSDLENLRALRQQLGLAIKQVLARPTPRPAPLSEARAHTSADPSAACTPPHSHWATRRVVALDNFVRAFLTLPRTAGAQPRQRLRRRAALPHVPAAAARPRHRRERRDALPSPVASIATLAWLATPAQGPRLVSALPSCRRDAWSFPGPTVRPLPRCLTSFFPFTHPGRCVPPEWLAQEFERAVPNHLIATIAGRQDFKRAGRDATGIKLLD